MCFRYLGDDDKNVESDETIVKKNLQALLSKIKQRKEDQQKPSNLTVIKGKKGHTNHTESTNNVIQGPDENPSNSKKDKQEEDDGQHNLSVDIEKLKVEDEDKNNLQNNVSHLEEGEVTNESFPIIGNIKFKKKIKVCS